MIDHTIQSHLNDLAWAGQLGTLSGKQPGTLEKPKVLDLPPDHPSHTPASAALAAALHKVRRMEYSKEMMKIHDLLSGE